MFPRLETANADSLVNDSGSRFEPAVGALERAVRDLNDAESTRGDR